MKNFKPRDWTLTMGRPLISSTFSKLNEIAKCKEDEIAIKKMARKYGFNYKSPYFKRLRLD